MRGHRSSRARDELSLSDSSKNGSHLSRFRGEPVTLLEIGVLGGGSLQMWRSYLGPQSRITPRVSIQWRFARRTGRPFQGASYRAPLHYDR